MATGDTNANTEAARDVYARFYEMRVRGHDDFCNRARRCEDFYLGAGLQWSEEDAQTLDDTGRMPVEINEIMPMVNAAIGYQLAHRMDISFLPRGYGTDDKLAKVFSKVAKHALDNTNYRYIETQAFADGMIQSGRGYIDLRMDFSENPLGEIKAFNPDPMDVGIDPDARDYDPDTWTDVILSRWLTLNEIEALYGKAAREAAKEHGQRLGLGYRGDVAYTLPEKRPTGFGNGIDPSYFGYGRGYSISTNGYAMRYLVLERQSFEMKRTLVGQYPTGDIRIVDGMSPEFLQRAIEQGVLLSKKQVRRVKFDVCVPDYVLSSQTSLYEHFTIVPFFPYFRRGRTRGLVDNAISPQELTNKALSKAGTIMDSVANSGWVTWEDTLNNITSQQLEDRGSDVGLILELKKDTSPDKKPQKIQPNQFPTGLEKMIEIGHGGIQRTSGINESLLGNGQQDMSGIAIQSRQFAAQQQLAVPNNSMSLTRTLVGRRVQKYIQRFMIDERIIRITDQDEFGVEKHTPMTVNAVQPDGTVLNDLTVGEYDLAISETPISVTFDNSQYEQIKEIKEAGAPIPWSILLRYSTLPDKAEIADICKQAETAKPDPVAEATVNKLNAEADFAKAQATAKNIEGLFSATRAAQLVTADPGAAALADAIARSAGFIDQDAAPIIPTPDPGMQPQLPPPTNTNPLTPDNPQRGMQSGIETSTPPQPEQ